MNSSTRLTPVPTPGSIAPIHSTNPFSTRWVRPGAVPYRFAAGVNAAALIEQLRAYHWQGAIVGPHGSGKSTLLATLTPHLEQAGRQVRLIALHDGQRKLPPNFLSATSRERPELAIIDGYEQLSWLGRRRLHSYCRRSGSGLLISVHADSATGRLPVVYRTTPDLATVRYLVEHALPPHDGLIDPDDVAAAFSAHGGNVREALFALYDLFEQRRRLTTGSSPYGARAR